MLASDATLLSETASHQWYSINKVVYKNFATFTGKHLCWNFFLIKLQDFKAATLLTKDSNTGFFSCECCEIFKIT